MTLVVAFIDPHEVVLAAIDSAGRLPFADFTELLPFYVAKVVDILLPTLHHRTHLRSLIKGLL